MLAIIKLLKCISRVSTFEFTLLANMFGPGRPTQSSLVTLSCRAVETVERNETSETCLTCETIGVDSEKIYISILTVSWARSAPQVLLLVRRTYIHSIHNVLSSIEKKAETARRVRGAPHGGVGGLGAGADRTHIKKSPPFPAEGGKGGAFV